VTALLPWQLQSAANLDRSLKLYGVAADGSDTGTGKTYKLCAVAQHLGKPLVVLCPKSVVPEWLRVAELFGVPCEAINYEKVRTGKTKHGRWQVKGKVFEWTIPNNAVLVFDEAHRCGGMGADGRGTQNATLLIAAKRQKIPHVLLSATLVSSPLKAYAIGFVLDLHRLTNFWPWARSLGVRDGFYGPEWKPEKMEPPQDAEAVMQSMRVALGDKFTRIRKADVPDFPKCQIIPTFVPTEDMPELASDYDVAARQTVELLKVPGLIEKAKDLVEEGVSVAVFVNFRATLAKLFDAFPKAALVYGGQTPTERSDALNRFQQNETHVILLMSQAGGTGVSLHDLNGRPRAALICPGYDAVEFLQVLGRIHRAASLSMAMNFIVFASGVPVERRIRARLEAKLTNMTALNDHDLGSNHVPLAKPNASGGAPSVDGPSPLSITEHADQPNAGGGRLHDAGTSVGPQGSSDYPIRNGGGPMKQTIAPNPADITITATPVAGTHQVPATPVAHVERKHARCSPSKLKNLEICPSYVGDNDGPVHPVTLRGTAMHEALEKADDTALDPDGKTVEHELVTMCREFQDAEQVPGEIVILEPHLKTHDRDVQGFADRVVIEPPNAQGRRKARIRDYKFGFNLVDLPNVNPQAIAYVVALFLESLDIDEINFAFLIPRLDAILEHTFHRSELPALKLRLSVIADRVRQLSGKEFNLVEENCLYCGLKATCPKTTAKMLPIRNSFAEADRLPVPDDLRIEALSEPQQIAYALNLARMAQDWAEKVNGFALRYRLELGQEIPGYDLIERQGKRDVTDPNAAFIVAKEFGVTEVEFLGAAKMSITALEAAVKEHAGAGDKAKAAGRFTDRLMDANAISRGGAFHVLQKSRKKAKPAALAA
jgi:hypothetical protein